MSLPASRIFGLRKPGAEKTCLNLRPQNLLPTSGEAKHDRVLPRRMNSTGSCRLIEIVVMNDSIVEKNASWLWRYVSKSRPLFGW